MKLSLSTPNHFSVRDKLMDKYRRWSKKGKRIPPTAEILVGMYSVLYQRKYKMLPLTPVQDDIEAFETFLRIIHEDVSVAPYCLEALFSLKEFHMKSSAFANRKVIDKWNVVERAHKLRNGRNGVGEQAEYRSSTKSYGVVRI